MPRGEKRRPTILHVIRLPDAVRLHDIEVLLELHDQLPLILAHVIPEELLQGINTPSTDRRVERVLFFEMTAVERLVRTFDLDGNRRLTLFADWDLLVVAFD